MFALYALTNQVMRKNLTARQNEEVWKQAIIELGVSRK